MELWTWKSIFVGIVLKYFNNQITLAESHRILAEVYSKHARAEHEFELIWVWIKRGNEERSERQTNLKIRHCKHYTMQNAVKHKKRSQNLFRVTQVAISNV